MNEDYNALVGINLAKKREEHEEALKKLASIKSRERKTYLRYVMKLDSAEIHTNNPDPWLEQGAVIVREVTPTGDDKRRRGRPRKGL